MRVETGSGLDKARAKSRIATGKSQTTSKAQTRKIFQSWRFPRFRMGVCLEFGFCALALHAAGSALAASPRARARPRFEHKAVLARDRACGGTTNHPHADRGCQSAARIRGCLEFGFCALDLHAAGSALAASPRARARPRFEHKAVLARDRACGGTTKHPHAGRGCQSAARIRGCLEFGFCALALHAAGSALAASPRARARPRF